MKERVAKAGVAVFVVNESNQILLGSEFPNQVMVTMNGNFQVER